MLQGQVRGGTAPDQNGTGDDAVDAELGHVDVHLFFKRRKIAVLLIALVDTELQRIVTKDTSLPAKRNVRVNIQPTVFGHGVAGQQLVVGHRRIHGNRRIMDGRKEIALSTHQSKIAQAFEILQPRLGVLYQLVRLLQLVRLMSKCG